MDQFPSDPMRSYVASVDLHASVAMTVTPSNPGMTVRFVSVDLRLVSTSEIHRFPRRFPPPRSPLGPKSWVVPIRCSPTTCVP